MDRKYKVLIDRNNIKTLKDGLKSDESLCASFRIPTNSENPPKPIITISIKLISKNKADLVLETIKFNEGEIVGNPESVGQFDEKTTKFKIIKVNAWPLILTWIGLTATGFISNLDNLTTLKYFLIPTLTIAISFGIVFGKNLRMSIRDSE